MYIDGCAFTTKTNYPADGLCKEIAYKASAFFKKRSSAVGIGDGPVQLGTETVVCGFRKPTNANLVHLYFYALFFRCVYFNQK